MLLRKLETYGFKSFADRTELEFDSGITAIVGPNGSGKSNISDAVRWVLGEQSTRLLRGVKMEDFIFAGSSTRRALGVAEVLLTFDNTDGTLPLDFNEVTIARRVFRSGESEYFINKTHCRLKDIHDLLADTGLGRDSMAIIGQNKIDEILNSKPEERRLLFEEAAGITKYKQRKKEAVRKLEDTEHNLTRVADIVAEIETQLSPLAESAERTARYNELHTELTTCQVSLLLDKLEKAEKMVESAELERSARTDEEITLNTRLSLAEAERERLTGELFEVDQKLTVAESNINQISTELERADGKIAVLDERIKQEKHAQTRIQDDSLRLEQKKNEIQDKIMALNEIIEAKKQQASALNNELVDKTHKYQEIINAANNLEQQLETGKEATFGHLQELVSERNNLRSTERDITMKNSRLTNLEKEQHELHNQLSQAESHNNELAAESTTVQNILTELETKDKVLIVKKQNLEQALESAITQEQRIVTKTNELASRLKVLSSMQDEYEGFGRGIKSVLKSDAAWRSGICGAVAEIISVPEKYVIAVEIALGSALQHIITLDDETAKQAIAFLKRQNLGRATFLPISNIKTASRRDFETQAAQMEGAVGFTSDVVTCEPKYRNAIDFLLGRTVIAENIDAALKIARKHSFNVKVVTLDGELVHAGGSMTGGSTHRRESSFLSRSNEIQVAETSIKDIEIQLASIREKIDGFKTDLTGINDGVANIQEHRRTAELRQAEIAVHVEKVKVDINRLMLTKRTLEEEFLLNQQELTDLQVRLLQIGDKIAVLENQGTENNNQITKWQQELKDCLAAKESLNASLTETKVEIASLEQELSALTTNHTQYMQNTQDMDFQVRQLTAEKNNISDQITLAEMELDEVKATRSQMIERKTQEETLRQTIYTAKLDALSNVQKLEKELKDLRRKSNDLQNRLHEAQLIATKYSYEVTHCIELLRDTFTLTVEQAKAVYRAEKHDILTENINLLETEIAALGPINPAAIDEYNKINERYQFLQKQSQDLTVAKDYLLSIIKDIDNTMRKQFKAAFETINGYFGDIFARLFGGGVAKLYLLEPDNILDSGVEIIVQPPGKKQQNLSLLSGGERALTVIALLFSFLTYRPAPFCVLDEIDAALDEANVQRFSDFLREYAGNTQFVIVTHRKGTMEAANAMHGVTMEESGVSKMVSVKFMEQAS